MSAQRAAGLVLGVLADAAVGQRRQRLVPEALRDRVPARRVGDAALAAGFALDRLGTSHPLAGVAGTALATWGALGGAQLATSGAALVRDLETGDLDAVRATLAPLDPRHTEELDRIGLTRASVEAVAENTSAAVLGPLVWCAVAGPPGLLAHRLVKAARSVTVRRRLRRRSVAVAVQHADELVDLIPTRATAALTVAAAPVVGGSAHGAWVAWRRDAAAHPSPNAGRVEAAFAGALEIRLGGKAVYPNRVQELPVLGAGRNPDAGHLTRAVELSRLVAWFGGAGAAALAIAFGRRREAARPRPRRGSPRRTSAA